VAEKLLALLRKNIAIFIRNHPVAEREKRNKYFLSNIDVHQALRKYFLSADEK